MFVAAEDSDDVTALATWTLSIAQCLRTVTAFWEVRMFVVTWRHTLNWVREKGPFPITGPELLRTEAGQASKTMRRFRDTRQRTKSTEQAILQTSWFHPMYVVISGSLWNSSSQTGHDWHKLILTTGSSTSNSVTCCHECTPQPQLHSFLKRDFEDSAHCVTRLAPPIGSLPVPPSPLFPP